MSFERSVVFSHALFFFFESQDFEKQVLKNVESIK